MDCACSLLVKNVAAVCPGHKAQMVDTLSVGQLAYEKFEGPLASLAESDMLPKAGGWNNFGAREDLELPLHEMFIAGGRPTGVCTAPQCSIDDSKAQPPPLEIFNELPNASAVLALVTGQSKTRSVIGMSGVFVN